MKTQVYLSPEQLNEIEARAHRMRAQATAEAAHAVKAWFRDHMHFGAGHKA